MGNVLKMVIVQTKVTLRAIWDSLHNFKNVENTHGGGLVLAKHSFINVIHIYKLSKWS